LFPDPSSHHRCLPPNKAAHVFYSLGVAASPLVAPGALDSPCGSHDALATNLLSAVRVDRELLPLMVQQGSGSVVHVSSAQWKRPSPLSPAYGPAKAARPGDPADVARLIAFLASDAAS
jgi:NAD(P)-dependent dehydrogenase (short-subunit alcohol dehydrogenase family)